MWSEWGAGFDGELIAEGRTGILCWQLTQLTAGGVIWRLRLRGYEQQDTVFQADTPELAFIAAAERVRLILTEAAYMLALRREEP